MVDPATPFGLRRVEAPAFLLSKGRKRTPLRQAQVERCSCASKSPLRLLSNEQGFTLVEMLAVLTILGIAAALFAARMQREPGSFQRTRAAMALESAIAVAEREARSSGKAVVLDPGAHVSGAVAKEQAFAAPAGQILFHPDGSTSGGVIVLAERPLLRVDWLTGDVARAE